MNEIDKMNNNNKGEKPNVRFDILRVTNLTKPKEALADFKQVLITILENKELDSEDEKWSEILPSNFVNVINTFEDEDYRKDDSVTSLDFLIDDVKNLNLKEWEWYSSKVTQNGFEVYFEGIFRIRFTAHLRFLGILASSVSIERKGVVFPIKLRNDVIQYKNLSSY